MTSKKRKLKLLNETDQFKAAEATTEQLAVEYAPALAQQQQAALPSTWKDGVTGAQMQGAPIQIVTPDPRDIARFSSPRAAICGACKYFDLENGRKEIVRQRFGERLVREMEWKLHHLGADIDAIGLCGASGGEMAVTFVSGACDQFRLKG